MKIAKFGGFALATPDLIRQASNRICTLDAQIVVVSAMGETTDHLLALGREVNPQAPRREMDMLVSVGERVSMALMAMALEGMGRPAVSFTGSQAGIITSDDHSDARIVAVRPTRVAQALDEGKTVIVAGFQGVSEKKEITTLGRGGSDTTAVALGAAFCARSIHFFKDVDGVYSSDPKKGEAMRLPHVSFSEARDIAKGGSFVIHPRALALAETFSLPLHIAPFNREGQGSIIGSGGRQRGDLPQDIREERGAGCQSFR